MTKGSTDRRLVLWTCLSFALLAVAGALWHVPWRRLVRLPVPTLQPATPAEIAAAQAAYDASERSGPRGERFETLTDVLDRAGRGVMTEQQIVQRLGPPDAQHDPPGTRRMIVYYWDRFGRKDWYAAAVFNNGTLVHFGYNASSELPAAQLQPYVAPPPTTGPSTAPATSPATRGVTPR